MSLVFGAATTDRVTVPLSRTPDMFTLLMWHYPTTITNLRRLMGRGDNATYDFSVFWATGSIIKILMDRAVGSASANGQKVYTTNKWWFTAVSFVLDSAPKIFWGDQASGAREDTYSASGAGTSGSLTDDSGQAFGVGGHQDPAPGSAYQGRAALFARFGRALSLAEICRFQFEPFVDQTCDCYMRLGEALSGGNTQINEVRRNLDGALVGATVGQALGVPPPLDRFTRASRLGEKIMVIA